MHRQYDRQGSPLAGHPKVNLPLCFQGKLVKGQGDAREEVTGPLQRCGSVAPLRSVRRYRAQGTLPGQHFSQRQVHLMSAPPISYNFEVIFPKMYLFLHFTL